MVPGSAVALDRPTEYAERRPTTSSDAIVSWVGAVRARPRTHRRRPTSLPPGGARSGITEQVVRLGPRRLVGVLTEPAGGPRGPRSSGSTPAPSPTSGTGTGLGRLRPGLAGDGYASVRLDFSGWGESPDLGHAPGRPYDAHCMDEVADVVADLHARGHRPGRGGRTVRRGVDGHCGGGRTAGSTASSPSIRSSTGNPATRWRRASSTRPAAPSPSEIRRLQPDPPDRGLVGARRRSASAIRRPDGSGRIDRLGTPVLIVFAEGDDGLEFLEDRVGRAWASVLRHGHIVLAAIPGIDHAMHRVWLRPALTEVLLDWLDRFCTDGAASPPGAGRPGSDRPARHDGGHEAGGTVDAMDDVDNLILDLLDCLVASPLSLRPRSSTRGARRVRALPVWEEAIDLASSPAGPSPGRSRRRPHRAGAEHLAPPSRTPARRLTPPGGHRGTRSGRSGKAQRRRAWNRATRPWSAPVSRPGHDEGASQLLGTMLHVRQPAPIDQGHRSPRRCRRPRGRLLPHVDRDGARRRLRVTRRVRQRLTSHRQELHGHLFAIRRVDRSVEAHARARNPGCAATG